MPKNATFDVNKIKTAVAHANFKNFGHGGAIIRKMARSLIKKSKTPSAPGSPVHTRRGDIKKAILYAASKTGVIVGPSFAVVGKSAEAHEKGIVFKGRKFDKRAFMVPALMKVRAQIPRIWAASVKGSK